MAQASATMEAICQASGYVVDALPRIAPWYSATIRGPHCIPDGYPNGVATMSNETIDPWAEISEGVRELVRWLNANHFHTTDSGDGSNHAAGMECALPFPMVAIDTEPKALFGCAHRLLTELRCLGVDFGESEGDPRIEATYNPLDGLAIVLLVNVTDETAGFYHG